MRRIFSVLALVAIVGGAASAVTASPVAAQTGYPPPACTPASGTQDAGTHAIGASFNVTLSPVCVWDPGTPVNLVVNGQGGGTKPADGAGRVSVGVSISGSPGAVQITVNPTVAGQCGANTIVGSGASSVARGTVTQSAVFNVACQAAAAAGGGGLLAFTGANLLRWAAIAVVLVGLGSFLVITRRRRAGISAA